LGRRTRNRGRNVNGILILDKPYEQTSNGALQRVKSIFGAAKAGHTGSLDPLATGVLPLCFGQATKFSRFLLDADKAYRVRAKLGVKTASGDLDGEVIRTCVVENITSEKLKSVLDRFRGEIGQIPSMYSALKHKGQPLYKLARQGIEVERKTRKIEIYELKLTHFETDEFELSVKCSKGTYIRTLVEDIAEAMGSCAHVISLRRIQVGPYTEDHMISLDDLAESLESGGHRVVDKLLLPLGSSVQGWPELLLSESTEFYLRNGQPTQVPKAPLDGWVRLSDANGEFVGVGEMLDDGRVAPRRLVNQD